MKMKNSNLILILTSILIHFHLIAQVKTDSIRKTDSAVSTFNKKSKFKIGTYYVGANLNFSGKEAVNDFVVLNIDIPDSKSDKVNFSFSTGYFLTPTMSLGLRGKLNLKKTEQTLRADFLGITFNAEEYTTKNISQGFQLHPYARNYFPIGNSGHFYIFSETSIYYGYNRSLSRAISNPGMNDERIRKVISDISTFGLGVSPGMTYFTKNNFAVEFQLGATGFEYTIEKSLTDDITKGKVNKFNFRDGLSFLNVQFGFTYYFKNKW
jgi:hypothetical protein